MMKRDQLLGFAVCLAAGFLGGVAANWLFGSSQLVSAESYQDAVYARRFVVVDDSGKEVASFGYHEGAYAGGRRPDQPRYFLGSASLEINGDSPKHFKSVLNENGLSLHWDHFGAGQGGWDNMERLPPGNLYHR